MIHAAANGPQDAECAEFARRHGWDDAPGEPVVILCRRLDPGTLAGCLEPPRLGCCEMEAFAADTLGRHFMLHLATGGLGLALRTDTAYGADLGNRFVAALKRRLLQPGETVADLDLTTHEMVANALIHGNLGITSPRPDSGGFEAYCREMDRRLATPELVRRRIELSGARVGPDIEIAVRDEGGGYLPGSGHPRDARRRHGLEIVALAADAVCTEEHGRCTVARFPILPGPEGG